MFKRLFARNPHDSAAQALYQAAVEQARQDAFYRDLQVPDTLDGRFEMICLHVYLLLTRLKQEPATPKSHGPNAPGKAQELAQTLFDTLFVDMDRSLREMGAGDLGVAPRVKKMGQAFYGRMAAYDAALAGEGETVSEALRRNVYGTVDEIAPEIPDALSVYLRRELHDLAAQPYSELAKGRVRFGAPPRADILADSGCTSKRPQADQADGSETQASETRESN